MQPTSPNSPGTPNLAALIDSLPGIAFSCANDSEWSMQYLSEGCYEVTGYKSEELVGPQRLLSFNDLTYAADLPHVLAAIHQALSGGSAYVIEYRIRTRSGQEKWLWEKGRGVYDNTGILLSVDGFITDITELKATEAALRQVAEELARSNAELEQFAYLASHDLQEPLRMVSSYTQLLARRYKGRLDQDADDFIGFAVDGVHRMQALINDLLSYSRVTRQNRNLVSIDCETLLAQVLANLKVAIGESGATITYDSLPVMMGDPSQFIQLFQNLLSNAIKFRGEAPPIVHISATPVENHWLFSVADNGIGIEHQHLEKIFAIFQRLHTRNQYSGTGIGLAICKKIVEGYRGQIWAESEPGQGSTFYIKLPNSLPQ